MNLKKGLLDTLENYSGISSQDRGEVGNKETAKYFVAKYDNE